MLNAETMKKIWKPMLGTCLMICGAGSPAHLHADPAAPAAVGKNAFDVYLQASKLLVDNKKVSYAIATTHTSSDPDDRQYTLTEEQALLAENAGALKTLRSGFAYPYRNPQYHSFSALLPYYASFRALARLLALEGSVYFQQGNWSEAVNSDLDAVKLGEDIPHGSIAIGALVGMACQAIGRRHIWDALNHLDETQAKAAMTRLIGIQAGHFPLPDTVLVEKMSTTDSIKEVLHDPRWKTQIDQIFLGETQPVSDAGNSDSQVTTMVTDYWTQDKVAAMSGFTTQQILADEDAYWEAAIRYIRQPYASDVPGPDPSGDPLSNFIRLNLKELHLKAADTEVQNSLLITALALRAFQSEHGAYPEALSSLVPAYLKQVPSDLFALSGPLHYHRTGDTYMLYSVGPDGRDNGGTPINDADSKFVRETSKGDIVAGINP